MEKAHIITPVFTMFLLTIAVWSWMYFQRIRFIQSRNLGPEEMTPLEFARISPPHVANPSDNLKNLFEIPVLFYTLCLYLYVSDQVDLVHTAAAWVFVFFRILHSAVHCTINIILLRFWLYLIATVTLWFMSLRAIFILLVA